MSIVSVHEPGGWGDGDGGTPPPLSGVTSPTNGSTQPTVYSISGTATPGALVSLYYDNGAGDSGLSGATPVQADATTGAFTFGGSTPSPVGPMTHWVVDDAGYTSPKVTFTVA